jgi:hypothetical protein
MVLSFIFMFVRRELALRAHHKDLAKSRRGRNIHNYAEHKMDRITPTLEQTLIVQANTNHRIRLKNMI